MKRAIKAGSFSQARGREAAGSGCSVQTPAPFNGDINNAATQPLVVEPSGTGWISTILAAL